MEYSTISEALAHKKGGELEILGTAILNKLNPEYAILLILFNIIFRLAFNENYSYHLLFTKIDNQIFIWKLKKNGFDSEEYDRLEKLVF